MFYLCELTRGISSTKAYISEKDAIVGRIVKLELHGKLTKGFVVDSIIQPIEDKYVDDNHLAYKVIEG